MSKPFLFTLSLVLFLAGCASNAEMPYAPVDTDEMRPSPCACVDLDYQPQSFEWVEAAHV
ncbi:hypothetical protein PsAD46_03472 [Pseudovibrio sp. Ad46]|uniref:hypothetical protein n=1 Tax=unclassified Pseudovibrio TaxID=2627060 RepID=UPI0007AE7786|nr:MULTISPECIES: hypothetical protein [unclassified Pseudovibrio]KZK84212.1 hypothetical protein PsAD46_03472 [Pseudovibrio sp. Ad46]KZK98949.1 hypothetical protein PsAD5_01572 [Pseudovibrio sp. Ad5]